MHNPKWQLIHLINVHSKVFYGVFPQTEKHLLLFQGRSTSLRSPKQSLSAGSLLNMSSDSSRHLTSPSERLIYDVVIISFILFSVLLCKLIRRFYSCNVPLYYNEWLKAIHLFLFFPSQHTGALLRKELMIDVLLQVCEGSDEHCWSPWDSPLFHVSCPTTCHHRRLFGENHIQMLKQK